MSCNHENEHRASVALVEESMPTEGEIEVIGNVFKAISEPCRLKILFALNKGELCVYHIVRAVGGTQSAVSHQLRILRNHRVIRARREGQYVLYSLADAHVARLLDMAREHLSCE